VKLIVATHFNTPHNLLNMYNYFGFKNSS